jgi:nucleotide-binding universal stress UspA family protein
MARLDLIMVPIDFSPASTQAAEYAAWLAARLGARIRLLHVLPEFSYSSAGVAPGMHAELIAAWREMRQRVDEEMAAFAARVARAGGGGTGPVQTRVVETQEPTADAIVRAACDDRADLIVMGTQGRTGLRRMVLGSVAEQVIRAAHCPVLAVKEP